MAKSIEQLQNSKAGSTAESNGFGGQEKPLRASGVYQLKDDDNNVIEEVILKVHPTFGDSQVAAAERIGFRYARPVKSGDIKEIELDARDSSTSSGVSQGDLKGLQARLDSLEKENTELKAKETKKDGK